MHGLCRAELAIVSAYGLGERPLQSLVGTCRWQDWIDDRRERRLSAIARARGADEMVGSRLSISSMGVGGVFSEVIT